MKRPKKKTNRKSTPAADYVLPPGKALVLRTCKKDMSSNAADDSGTATAGDSGTAPWRSLCRMTPKGARRMVHEWAGASNVTVPVRVDRRIYEPPWVDTHPLRIRVGAAWLTEASIPLEWMDPSKDK